MKENYVGGYNGFSVIGRCGAIKPSLSEVFVDYNEKALLGFPLDLDTWDGSDIFLVEKLDGPIFFTKKLKDLFRKQKITNALFEDSANYTIAFSSLDIWINKLGIQITE